MQRQLQMASCQSIGRLLAAVNPDSQCDSSIDGPRGVELLSTSSSVSSPASAHKSPTSLSSTELAGFEDDDYAASTSDTSASSSAAELCKANCDREEHDNIGAQQRKEVLLKVVVDESEQGPNGDEVFYMNPSVSFSYQT